MSLMSTVTKMAIGFAMAKGMADLLPNGNMFVNYGTGGIIREVTPDNKIAWEVIFNKKSKSVMAENNILFDDLYALNVGPDGS